MVLAADDQHCAGIDRGTGVLVRAWFPGGDQDGPPRPLQAYDVVTVTVAGDDEVVPDPAEPEAVVLDGPPEPIGRLTGRRAERLLRPLLHPARAPLLSSHAPAIPFWERRADHPSIAVVEPAGPVTLHREGSWLGCRFQWLGTTRELPCLDRRLAAAMDRSGQRQLTAVRRARLLVSLTPPIEGHCHKVVEALLPHP
jgi:hypothetical protein